MPVDQRDKNNGTRIRLPTMLRNCPAKIAEKLLNNRFSKTLLDVEVSSKK